MTEKEIKEHIKLLKHGIEMAKEEIALLEAELKEMENPNQLKLL